ncbi:MATE family efflux transporter [Rarobacter incanus]|uniref:Putative MATE family efflux protein n=1 Tax=Rarobacter incanus TaxID=153494 RepID=A0A542SQ16_9MICO|nr:MATE family efflux transporter [Rarobacter incanus]TQK76706.1 putative MATE family efflux protein [Rarobacter incanus]
MQSKNSPGAGPRTTPADSRRILALAVPALGALVAEPLFILADTAIVGRLGADALAALSVASTALMTVVGLCVFLAYATTSLVARRIGAGDPRAALRAGVDGLWLSFALGIALAIALGFAATDLLRALGAHGSVLALGTAYLRASAAGIPGMLAVLAATGVLRGFQDTRTPLYLTVVGASANALLNVVLVFWVGLGIVGSGLGTAACQLGMGAVAAAIVMRRSRAHAVSLRPRPQGLLGAARSGVPLFIRTLSLRAAIIVTVAVATRLGEAPLAGHQIVTAVWNLIAYALDALAIAAQALIGHALGAGRIREARRLLRIMLRWGVVTGAVCGVAIAATSAFIPWIFTDEAAVAAATSPALIAAAVFLPMAGWVFVLDGVLIGAGDGRYLAWVGLLTLAAYVPAVLAVGALTAAHAHALVWLWVAFGGWFMATRALTTGLRARTDAWLRAGI